MYLPNSYEECVKWKLAGNSFDQRKSLSCTHGEMYNWLDNNIEWLVKTELSRYFRRVQYKQFYGSRKYHAIRFEIFRYLHYIEDCEDAYDEILDILVSNNIIRKEL